MDPAESEFSILLWGLGVVVALLALHLSQGWVRMAQRGPTLRHEWRALLLASAVLAAGLTSAAELGLQAQDFSFPLGYRWLAAVLLLPGAVLLSAPAVLLSAHGNRPLALVGSGALLAAAALLLQMGWIWAGGFRPGVYWHVELVAATAVLLGAGLALAQWLTRSAAVQASHRRTLWRVGGAALGAVVLMLGQLLLTRAAGLHEQGASLFADELPGAVLSLVCGVLVPLVLVAMMLDLWLRRQQRPLRGHEGFKPARRRKRRHKMRPL